jgi:hypothetical protein
LITDNHIKEALSLAYAHALAGIAGVNLHLGPRHDYGVDGTFRPVKIIEKRRIEDGFPIDFQLKSTVNWEVLDKNILIDLEIKNI